MQPHRLLQHATATICVFVLALAAPLTHRLTYQANQFLVRWADAHGVWCDVRFGCFLFCWGLSGGAWKQSRCTACKRDGNANMMEGMQTPSALCPDPCVCHHGSCLGAQKAAVLTSAEFSVTLLAGLCLGLHVAMVACKCWHPKIIACCHTAVAAAGLSYSRLHMCRLGTSG